METRQISGEDISACQAIFNASYFELHQRYGMEDVASEETSWLTPILTLPAD